MTENKRKLNAVQDELMRLRGQINLFKGNLEEYEKEAGYTCELISQKNICFYKSSTAFHMLLHDHSSPGFPSLNTYERIKIKGFDPEINYNSLEALINVSIVTLHYPFSFLGYTSCCGQPVRKENTLTRKLFILIP